MIKDIIEKDCKICGESFLQARYHGYFQGAQGRYLRFCSEKCREIDRKEIWSIQAKKRTETGIATKKVKICQKCGVEHQDAYALYCQACYRVRKRAKGNDLL